MKISFAVVYPADGDRAVSKTLLLHYLLTTSDHSISSTSMCWFWFILVLLNH